MQCDPLFGFAHSDDVIAASHVWSRLAGGGDCDSDDHADDVVVTLKQLLNVQSYQQQRASQ